MPTFTAFTTLAGRDAAEALGRALEAALPENDGIGVIEIEDGSGRHEVAGPTRWPWRSSPRRMAPPASRSRNCPKPTGSRMSAASWRRSRPGGSSSMAGTMRAGCRKAGSGC